MNNDVIDRVRLLAPVVEPTSETERARQRGKLTDAIAAESTLPDLEGASRHRRKRRLARGQTSRRRVYLAGAAAAIVAAAGTAIPLSLGGGSPAAPVMQLASYRLRLPASYHLTAATTTGCPGAPGFVIAESETPAVYGFWQAKYPNYEPQLKAAANADGGCVSMLLAPPYTPTTATPDPEAQYVTDAQPVQVGPYRGAFGTGLALVIPVGPNGPVEPETLYVEIPVGGGQDEDLVVNSYGMSASALVSLVQNGLSVVGSSATSGTPIGSLHGNTGSAGNSGAVGNSGAAAGNSGPGGTPGIAGNSGNGGNTGAVSNTGTNAN